MTSQSGETLYNLSLSVETPDKLYVVGINYFCNAILDIPLKYQNKAQKYQAEVCLPKKSLPLFKGRQQNSRQSTT